MRGPSPAGAGGQSRKSGPCRPAASVGIAAHAISGELRFCRAVERCLPPHRCARRWLQGWIASPLAGVRPSPVGQIVALSGSERVYARHQWCRRLDTASDQCGVGVSGLWWVSDILRGMSLDGLVAQVGQVLGDARSLYGAAPQGGGWSSTQALSAGRDGIATAGGVVAGWGGAASSTHLAASGGRVLALDNVIGADGATGSGFGGAADTSQSGRNGMTGVVDDTRRGVAAIAPSTDTAAGKRQLVDHLQSELDRAKSLLKVSEQRNVMLAQLIRGGAGGYGGAGSRMGGGMSPMMGGGMGGMSPMSLGGGGMPGIPNLSSLSSLLGDGRRGRDRSARPGLTCIRRCPPDLAPTPFAPQFAAA